MPTPIKKEGKRCNKYTHYIYNKWYDLSEKQTLDKIFAVIFKDQKTFWRAIIENHI